MLCYSQIDTSTEIHTYTQLITSITRARVFTHTMYIVFLAFSYWGRAYVFSWLHKGPNNWLTNCNFTKRKKERCEHDIARYLSSPKNRKRVFVLNQLPNPPNLKLALNWCSSFRMLHDCKSPFWLYGCLGTACHEREMYIYEFYN